MKKIFFCIFLQSTHQVGIKNVVKCYKDFFGYFNALKTHCGKFLGQGKELHTKVSFFVQSTKTQLIAFQNFNIQTCFSQFLWFFSLKFWFKGQIISRIHIILPNVYKLMFFGRNINGNRDVKFLIGILVTALMKETYFSCIS